MKFKTFGNGEKAIRVKACLSNSRWLLYDPEMKAKIDAQKSDWMKFFLDARGQSWTENCPGKYGKTYEQGAMSVQRYFPGEGHLHSALWKVTIGPEAFFVKETYCGSILHSGPVQYMFHSGPAQYLSLLALAFVQTPQVRATEPYLAFWSKGNSFLVTEFIEEDKTRGLEITDRKKVVEFRREVDQRYYDRFTDIDILHDHARGELVAIDPLDLKYNVFYGEREWKATALEATLHIEQNGGWLREEFFSP